MKEEMKRIMKMVEEGKLSSDEASELIDALDKKDTDIKHKPSGAYLDKSLKIRVKSGDKVKVRLNIPIKFVKWVLKTGHGIAKSIPDAKPYIEDVDMNLVMQAIDNEIEGKIIDLESEEGETVEIYIE